jgi:hypothetical protein
MKLRLQGIQYKNVGVREILRWWGSEIKGFEIGLEHRRSGIWTL